MTERNDGNPKELSYTLVFVSSQDDATIEMSSIYSRDFIYGKGWISEQFCRFPQELILRLEEISTINQINMLTHHMFTPQNVDIFVGVPRNARNSNPHWTEAHFVGMGSAEFYNTAESDGTQSERKTIYTNAVGFFVKFVFGKNWEATWNKTGQVGILGIKLFGVGHGHGRIIRLDPHGDGGYVLGDGSDSDTYNADAIIHKDRQKRLTKKKKKEEDGKNREEPVKVLEINGRKFRPPSFVNHKEYDDLVELLEAKKQVAVYKRNYIDAKEIKIIQDDLKDQKKQIIQTHEDLMQAIANEDFETATAYQRQYDRDRFNCTRRYRHLPRFLNEKERFHYIENFGRRERAQQEGYPDPTKLDNQVEGDIPGRHYHYNPRRYGDPLRPDSTLWDNISTIDGGRATPTPFGDGVPPSRGAVSRGGGRPGTTMTRPDTQQNIRSQTGFPDEQRVQKILEMHRKKDKNTDAEITSVMNEMQEKNRTDLDWRLQKLMREYGVPWHQRIDNREKDVFGKNLRVPRSTTAVSGDKDIYEYRPSTALTQDNNITSTQNRSRSTNPPTIREPDYHPPQQGYDRTVIASRDSQLTVPDRGTAYRGGGHTRSQSSRR